MQKEKIRNSILGILAFVLLFYEIIVLKGENYETPVDSWVRITWSGTGFHAAPWQSWSSWTKDYYKVRGSHGCLNLEPSIAKKIYDMVKYREAVFIH